MARDRRMKRAEALVENDFPSPEKLAAALAADVRRQLAMAIEERGTASLAVSGGSTPALFFQHLSDVDLPWDKVVVTLVDERMVPVTHTRSNARLVALKLLQKRAAESHFIPLYGTDEPDRKSAQEKADRDLASIALPLDVVILGLGTDGHTASYFPGGDTLAQATDPKTASRVLSLSAPGQNELRLTLTLPLVAGARFLALHIEGAEKKEVLRKALTSGVASSMPIRAVLDHVTEKIEVYWSPANSVPKA